ncbi:MAG TPA: MBL fold metallo-hydrolase [Pseudogracilibacillus sp.]|nr:MBL fold metallo-hydrolase [Pseudogracilibacillus sp.]
MSTTVKAPIIYPIIVETDEQNLRSYNFYLVENNHKLFLVDAGYDDDISWNKFQEVLLGNGFGLEDLDAILLTHHHFDHLGLVNRILERREVPVYAHEQAIVRLRRDKGHLERRIRFFDQLYREMGCTDKRVDQEIQRLKIYVEKNELQIVDAEINILREGDEIFGFEVLEVIGHSLDHLAFYHRESKQMLVGDHMIQHMSSNALIDIDHRGKRPYSLVYYEKSLERVLNMPVDVAYSGHGDIIDEPHKLLRKKLKRIEDKGQLILQMLNKKQTPAMIAEKVYGERYKSLFPLVMSEIIGHMDRLHYKGRIRLKVEKGVHYYERSRRPRI